VAAQQRIGTGQPTRSVNGIGRTGSLLDLGRSEMGSLYSTTLLGCSVYQIVWWFVVYSVLGVVVETMFCLVHEGLLESRFGVLFLPLRPLYGVGGAMCTLLLTGLRQEPVLVFGFGMLIASVVEYLASEVMEKVFGTASWDYSDKVLNLHGRICVQYSVGWGLLALLTVYVINPVLSDLVGTVSRRVGEVVLTVLIILTLLSMTITLAALARLRHRVLVLQARSRGETVTWRDTPVDRMIDRLAPDPIMINTFPRASLILRLSELTGTERAWIRLPGHPARRPPPRRAVAESPDAAPFRGSRGSSQPLSDGQS